ncbi:MAG: tetratricopeptide repeat protein [Solirubrobacterales bacterium]
MSKLHHASAHRLATLALPLLAFAALFAILSAVNGSPPAPPTAASAALDAPAATQSTAQLVGELQAALGDDPSDPALYDQLGDAYYQRARETGDPAYYSRSQRAYDAALARDPGDPLATVGAGTLALARHDFAAGLRLGLRAHRLAPDLVRPYAVIADAQVELGRYGPAARSIDRFVGLKPTLAAYARVSYFRELHGDLDGAAGAMRLAVSAGGGSPENLAYVDSLLGKLEIDRGRYGAAGHAYREALAADPGFPAATAGLARVAAAAGHLDLAIARYRDVVDRLPLPEYVIGLGETEIAAGRESSARRDLALVGVEARLLRSAGVNVDAELAVYEADHGNPARAVALGRSAWRRAPSVRSADAYAWALHSAGDDDAALAMSDEALRLGSRDPSFLYHAGAISADAGATGRARRILETLTEQSPRFSPLYGPRAERLLRSLG